MRLSYSARASSMSSSLPTHKPAPPRIKMLSPTSSRPSTIPSLIKRHAPGGRLSRFSSATDARAAELG